MSLNDKQLEERKFLVTASNLPVICGLSPYSTPWELWAKKTGLVERSPSTLQQDLGSAFQEPIQRVANKHMDLHIIPNSLDVLVHSALPTARPSRAVCTVVIDGLTRSGKCRTGAGARRG